ncbi:MAG: lytic transglycosylase domain-containing protein [bacterium]
MRSAGRALLLGLGALAGLGVLIGSAGPLRAAVGSGAGAAEAPSERGAPGASLPDIEAPPADRVLRRRSETLLEDPAALLRSARIAVEQGDDAHADWLYGEIRERHPIVGDYAGLHRAQLRLSLQRAAEARQIASATLRAFPESPLRADLHRVVGDSLVAERDELGARQAYAAALAETSDDDARAALLRSVARSEERSGEDRAAGITWRLLWYAHPGSDEAEQASHRLDLIEAHLGETLRRASDWRRRGDRLFRLRQNEEALEAYETALEMGLSETESRRTREQRAHTLFRLRRYPEALEAFSSLPQTGDIPIWRARSLARADRVPESIEAFEKLARDGGGHAMRARYLAALLLDGRDRHVEARRHFSVLAGDPGQGDLAQAALWRLGWIDYQKREYARAAERFERLAETTRDPIDRLRPRYWQARALESIRPEEARALLKGLAEEFPLSYYGWRARERVAASEVSHGPHTISPGRSGLRPSEVERVRILMEAGLAEKGAEESARLTRRASGLDDRVTLARLLTSAGDYNRAQRVVVDAYTASLARGPVSGLEELWWYAWPPAFERYVDEATESGRSVPRELVYSIMREESGYRPEVVSPVGARGLLQIMRETGARLASRRGRESFDPDELFDPRTNIELGSFYLGELSQRFPDRLSASIASYNAGPHVVSDWVAADDRPDDEWVESIPYSQTRSYVKRVMRSLQAYRRLY